MDVEEKYGGSVHVVSVEVREPEQMSMELTSNAKEVR